jgi:hypothetical protein
MLEGLRTGGGAASGPAAVVAFGRALRRAEGAAVRLRSEHRQRYEQATAGVGGIWERRTGLPGSPARKRAHPPELALTGEKLNEPRVTPAVLVISLANASSARSEVIGEAAKKNVGSELPCVCNVRFEIHL